MKGFVFFEHYFEAISHLPDNERLKTYEALIKYAFDGIEPEERKITEEDPNAPWIIWVLSKDQLKAFEYGHEPYEEDWDGVPTERRAPIRNSAAYRHFREAVLERDGHTCQMCGTKNGTMNVHHIKPFSRYPELRVDVNNGITLCTKCHRKAHKHEKR